MRLTRPSTTHTSSPSPSPCLDEPKRSRPTFSRPPSA
jgi:hypothetical protein